MLFRRKFKKSTCLFFKVFFSHEKPHVCLFPTVSKIQKMIFFKFTRKKEKKNTKLARAAKVDSKKVEKKNFCFVIHFFFLVFNSYAFLSFFRSNGGL